MTPYVTSESGSVHAVTHRSCWHWKEGHPFPEKKFQSKLHVHIDCPGPQSRKHIRLRHLLQIYTQEINAPKNNNLYHSWLSTLFYVCLTNVNRLIRGRYNNCRPYQDDHHDEKILQCHQSDCQEDPVLANTELTSSVSC